MARVGGPSLLRRIARVERDAKYAAVALFVLLAVAAAFAFVWWYSGKGDRRVYERYEVYFDGTVSGLSQGSPVRYLGVDVGRVLSLEVDANHPGRVTVVAQIDSTAPISRATRARLGLLGLTGLLYIDLQLDPAVSSAGELLKGDRYPVIQAQKGDIEAFLEGLPDLVGQVGEVLGRIDRLLADENIAAVGDSLRNLDQTLKSLPGISGDAAVMMSDLQRTAAETAAVTARLRSLVDASGPELQSSLGNLKAAAERLNSTAVSLEAIVTDNEATLSQFAGTGVFELQQLLIDLRDASGEVAGLARSLRENPSSLLHEQKESGVEIAP
jgi:phospholipid/cholesterol/gamma-HCH transport system substrate-binding protein